MARHSPELEAAIAAVASGAMSLREAAREHGVPRTTLQRKVSRGAPPSSRRVVSTRSAVIADSPAPVALTSEDSGPPEGDSNVSSGDDSADVGGRSHKSGHETDRKRPAAEMAARSRSPERKGPRKAINCKIRMLCTAAGSALDELSNAMIREGKCIYKLGLGQSPFPIPQNMMWLPTLAEDHFVLRPEVLEAHCAKDPDAPRILILNSPSNPTGCAYQADEVSALLEALAEVARRYRILVISDEIYSELHHCGAHLSLSKYYPEGTIVSGGLSKWCGAGGWRMGFWLFPPTMGWLRSSMLVMASETYTSVASPIQHAARRAFVPKYVKVL
ncbi:hypothetical protein BBJ28_00010478 [Nothophytophthora sp. Chile5]|nr:hypothetical protein BBJ28_00010478 [Nothophytophthora sp. Chile5]